MKSLFFASLSFVLGAGIPFPAQAQTVPNYALDFDHGERMLSDGSIQKGSKVYSFKSQGGGVAPALFRHSRYKTNVLFFQMDPVPAEADRQRSEYKLFSQVAYGQFYYVGFKVLIPPEIEAPDNWNINMQCPQHNTDSYSPPLSLRMSGNSMDVVLLENYRRVKRSDRIWNRTTLSAPMEKGKWVRGVLRFNMGESGSVKLWLNNTVQIYQHLPIGYREPAASLPADNPKVQGCTFKFGVYRGPSQKKFQVFFDDVRFGTTYESVVPSR